jgi:primosomal protein N' (replication factor Y) (superfamily II helicase)
VRPDTGTCAEVLLDLSAPIAGRPLRYRVPAAYRPVMQVGLRVLVPLGPRRLHGYVVALWPCATRGDSPAIREILDITDEIPMFSRPLLDLARSVADDTLSTLLDAVRCLVPSEVARTVSPRPRTVVLSPTVNLPPRAGRRQMAIVAALRTAAAGLPMSTVRQIGGRLALRRLVDTGAVRVLDGARPMRAAQQPPLAPGGLGGPRSREDGRPLLVWGDAGARADWIVDATADACAGDRQALITVPEIALAATLVGRLRDALGVRVAVYHSDLPETERREVWTRIRSGHVDVVIGTRSALFVPLDRPGLIVVDDEHDPRYKSEAAPRYHGREVAIRRGEIQNARVVFGSGTPSLELYAAASEGHVGLLRLNAQQRPARIVIVDLKKDRQRGRTGLLSQSLVQAMRRHIRAGGSAVLYVNRVGYARALSCQECGEAVRCRRCGVPAAFDRESGTMACRICGEIRPAPDVCPRCKAPALRWIGAGTKRVLEVVQSVFPDVPSARLDRETAPAFDAIAGDLASGRLRIVVGTQLVLRARRVRPSLVGIIDADPPFYRPDFRAAERAFQQLRAVTALARAAPGPEAVIQTRIAGHPVFNALQSGIDRPLYEHELRIRSEFGYPPYAHLALVVASGRDLASARRLADRIAQTGRESGVDVLGPAAARTARAAGGSARVQCLFRSPAPDRVREAARRSADLAAPRSGSRITIDLDPQEMA